MAELAIIGGTGLTALSGLSITDEQDVDTPFGKPSDRLIFGTLAEQEIVFLPRHGREYALPPHRINYRANIRALHDCGVRNIIAVNAVGGIGATMQPTRLVIPDQIVDYTHGRVNTFHDGAPEPVLNVDFTNPYSSKLRRKLSNAGSSLALDLVSQATMGVTQGPRLETRAEIDRLARDGCDIVGMTAMPETGLARELELEYACIAVIANRAAGRGDTVITTELVERNLAVGMVSALRLIGRFILG